MKGGYVVRDVLNPDIILLSCGSELVYCMEAAEMLADQGIGARVVSMPSQEVFLRQSEEYRESVLPKAVRCRLAVEAGSTMSWYRFTGLDGKVIGIDVFGVSGKSSDLFEKFGFTAENVFIRLSKWCAEKYNSEVLPPFRKRRRQFPLPARGG